MIDIPWDQTIYDTFYGNEAVLTNTMTKSCIDESITS